MRNQDEASRLKKLWLATARYYGSKLDDDVLALYMQDVDDYETDSLMKAITAYRINKKNNRMPRPADIIDLINPQIDPELESREAAARITQAITKFGIYRGSEAREFVGEAGWYAVERYGGWSYLCENHGVNIDPTAFHAQVREIIKTAYKRNEMGLGDTAPQLGAPSKDAQSLVESIFDKQKKLGVSK